MSKTILVIEDEASILKLIEYNLEKEGYQVETAADGAIALAKIEEQLPDFIVLDLMLPHVDGLEICRRIRMQSRNVPILILTAKSDEIDVVLGLELGADDYMTKPFSPRELLARIKAILRRLQNKEQDLQENKSYRIGDLQIDLEGYEVQHNGAPVELTPKEFELLLFMVKSRGKVLSRDQLLNAVWNYDYLGDSRIVDVHVSHLRDKIENDSRSPVYIKTVRGIGYKFEGPKLL